MFTKVYSINSNNLIVNSIDRDQMFPGLLGGVMLRQYWSRVHSVVLLDRGLHKDHWMCLGRGWLRPLDKLASLLRMCYCFAPSISWQDRPIVTLTRGKRWNLSIRISKAKWNIFMLYSLIMYSTVKFFFFRKCNEIDAIYYNTKQIWNVLKIFNRKFVEVEQQVECIVLCIRRLWASSVYRKLFSTHSQISW